MLAALATTLTQKANSAVVAKGMKRQLPASASESLSTSEAAPIVSAVVAEKAKDVLDNFRMVYSFGVVLTVVLILLLGMRFFLISLVYRFAQLNCRSWLLNCRTLSGTIWLLMNLPGAPSGAS